MWISSAAAGRKRHGQGVLGTLVHKLSPARTPYVPKSELRRRSGRLLESELFAYERWAFTGATHPKPGSSSCATKARFFSTKLEKCHRSLQAKLLHVLQDQHFPAGSRTVIKVDVRILAATHINIP